MVRYVRHRPESASLGAKLAYLLSHRENSLSARSVRRHVKKFSQLTVSYWERVIRLAQVKMKLHESAEALAERHGWDVRTMRNHVRECCGVSLDEFRHLVGWEWRVEAALRIDAGGGGRIAES